MQTLVIYVANQSVPVGLPDQEMLTRWEVEVPQVGDSVLLEGEIIWSVQAVYPYALQAAPQAGIDVHLALVSTPDLPTWEGDADIADTIFVELCEGEIVSMGVGQGCQPKIGDRIPSGYVPLEPLPETIKQGDVFSVRALPDGWNITEVNTYTNENSPYPQCHIAHCELVPSLVA